MEEGETRVVAKEKGQKDNGRKNTAQKTKDCVHHVPTKNQG